MTTAKVEERDYKNEKTLRLVRLVLQTQILKSEPNILSQSIYTYRISQSLEKSHSTMMVSKMPGYFAL